MDIKSSIKKISKSLRSRVFKKKLIRYNFFLFPFLWAVALTLNGVEVFTYSGFIAKHIFFGSKFFLAAAVFSGVFVNITPVEKKLSLEWRENYKILSILNKLFFVPLLIVTIILVLIEEANFPNYIYSIYHIQPKNLFWLCFLSGFLIFINLGGWIIGALTTPPKITLTKTALVQADAFVQKKAFQISTIVALIFLILGINIYGIGKGIIKSLTSMAQHPLASEEEKMRSRWGEFYNYMVFLQENTPPEAIINFPPDVRPWLSVGNEVLIRYFLYPRKLVRESDEDPLVEISPETTHVMIAWGFWRCYGDDEKICHGWPKVKVPAEWIIYKKPDSSEVLERIENTIYNPDDERNKFAWGLIKIKKEK